MEDNGGQWCADCCERFSPLDIQGVLSSIRTPRPDHPGQASQCCEMSEKTFYAIVRATKDREDKTQRLFGMANE